MDYQWCLTHRTRIYYGPGADGFNSGVSWLVEYNQVKLVKRVGLLKQYRKKAIKNPRRER
jgi:hypothetical protein